MNKLYTVNFLGNVVDGQIIKYANVDINIMKKAAIKSSSFFKGSVFLYRRFLQKVSECKIPFAIDCLHPQRTFWYADGITQM